jgi:hypothetical protein
MQYVAKLQVYCVYWVYAFIDVDVSFCKAS